MKYNLSEITEVIKNRRTIYPEQYSNRKIYREVVEQVLNNAIWAPNHGMTQPWRFKVYMEDKKNELGEFMGELYKDISGEGFGKMKYEKIVNRPKMSSVVIAICMKKDESGRIAEIEEIQATACAVQNMYLTCTAYGIGGFWSTPKFISHPKLKEYIKINDEDLCLGFFYMGYPSIEWPKNHRKPIEYVTEWIS